MKQESSSSYCGTAAARDLNLTGGIAWKRVPMSRRRLDEPRAFLEKTKKAFNFLKTCLRNFLSDVCRAVKRACSAVLRNALCASALAVLGCRQSVGFLFSAFVRFP